MKDNLRVHGFDVIKTSSKDSKKFLSEKFVSLYYFITFVIFWILCAIRGSKWIVDKGVRIKELVSMLPIFMHCGKAYLFNKLYDDNGICSYL